MQLIAAPDKGLLRKNKLMLPETADFLADRLRIVTLTLERALAEDNWSEADTLFSERDRILEKLKSQELSANAKSILMDVQATEHRLMANIATWQASIQSEMRTIGTGKKSIAAYRKHQ